MQDSENFPDDIPVDIPVGDAVEQHRAIKEPVRDEEDTAEPPTELPLEAAGPDWQEQLQAVDFDPEEDMDV